MEEDSSKEAKGEAGGGDASGLLPLCEADKATSLAPNTDEGEVFTHSKVLSPVTSGAKINPCPETGFSNGPGLCDGASTSGADDIEMDPASEPGEHQSLSPDSGGKLYAASGNHKEKRLRLSPPSERDLNGNEEEEEEEGMSVDPDDVVLNLDQSVEGTATQHIQPASVQLNTVIDQAASSSLHPHISPSQPEADTSSKSPDGQTSASHSSSHEDIEEDNTEGAGSVGGDNLIESSTQEAQVAGPDDLPDLSTDSDDDTLDSDDDDDDDDDDDNEGAGVVNPRLLSASQRRVLRRQRRLAKVLNGRGHSSSSDSDDDSDNDGSGAGPRSEAKSSSRESEDEEVRQAVQSVLEKAKPAENWHALCELRRREYCSGQRLASGWFREGVQGSLQMVKRLVVVDRMKGHAGCVNALSFNRIGTLLASGSDDLDIILWNWQKGRPSVTYESGHRSNVFQAKFMPFSGDCHVISCARDGQVRLAELNSWGECKATRRLAQHRGAAHKLALEHDSPHVFLSCGEDALTFLFDLRQEKPHRLVTAKESGKKVPLYAIQSNPSDPHQFCVGGRDHYIRVYDKRKISQEADGGVLKKLCPDHLYNSEVKANVTCVCYSYNGAEILGSYNDEDIYLFDNGMSDGANYIHKYTGHRNSATVKGVNFYGPKSEFIVSGSDCGNVYFWDKETEAIINFQKGDDAGVINVLEPHPTLPVLATSGLDHDVKLWMPMLDQPHIDTEQLRKTIKHNLVERNLERVASEPEIGGQMLWFIMHHFRSSARRRMREEGHVLSTSEEEEEESHSDDSESNHRQCAQS